MTGEVEGGEFFEAEETGEKGGGGLEGGGEERGGVVEEDGLEVIDGGEGVEEGCEMIELRESEFVDSNPGDGGEFEVFEEDSGGVEGEFEEGD